MSIQEFIKKSGVNTDGIDKIAYSDNKVFFKCTGGGGIEIDVDVKRNKVVAYLSTLSGRASAEYVLKIEPEMLNEPNDLSDLEEMITGEIRKVVAKFDQEINKIMSKF